MSIYKEINKFYLKILQSSIIQRYYLWKYYQSDKGSVKWLIYHEIKYGGISSDIKRIKVSHLDPRSKNKLHKGGMTGGDRMLYHGYAREYAHYLLPYIKNKKNVNLVEVGILKGVGMAIWCDLFEGGRIIGFDIDLSHIEKNEENLLKLGAFKKNKPELYEFDQLKDNTDYIKNILNNDKINICIDDGLHSNESILKTMKSIIPFLADKFLYIVEDNKRIHREISSIYPEYEIHNYGELTVIINKG